MRWWRVTLIAVVVTALLAGLAVVVLWRDRDRPEPPSAMAALMAQLDPDHGVSVDLARQAFALMIAPLPGVTPPAGRGDDLPHSGSMAINWLLAHWDALTPEQRAAAAPYVDPYGSGGATPSGGPTVRVTPTSYGSQTRMPCGFDEPARAANANELSNLRTLAGTLAAKFNPPVSFDAALQLCYARDDLPDKQLDNGTTLTVHALTIPRMDSATGRVRCWIVVFPAGDQANQGEAYQRRLLYHELTHCLQDLLRAREAGSIPPMVPWVAEGICEWVASELTDTDWVQGDIYVDQPDLLLSRRSYDAVGFFALLHNVRGDNWATIPEIVRASARGWVEAFDAAVATQRDDVLNTWPASWFQEGRRGGTIGTTGPWRMSPIRTLDIPVSPTTLPVTDSGPPAAILAPPWGVEHAKTDLRSELVMLSLTGDGPVWGRFGPGPDGDFTLAEAASRVFCTRPGGCTCPDGAPVPVAGGATDIPPGPALVAITGGTHRAAVSVEGVRIADLCADPERYRPPPAAGPAPTGGCEDDCGGSNGDPHLVTFDGHYYDLQSVGEFVLTRSLDDELAVQARTTPIGGSRHASMNTAFAMAVAGTRVGFYVEDDEVIVRVDGVATTVPPAGLPLPRGGDLSPVDGVHRVTWPDGTAAWVTPVLPYGLSISMSVDASRAGRLAGPLGDFDGDQDNDLVTRDGDIIEPPASFDDLYPRYADSWRVTPAESLFDYGPGEDTATFTDRDFPDSSPPPLVDRPAAEAICRDAGITEPVLLENCIFDIGVTGDPVFAADTAQLQHFLTSAGAVGRGAVIAGEFTDALPPGEHVLDLGEATVFYLRDAGGDIPVCQVVAELAGAPARQVDEECTSELAFGLTEPAPDGKVLLRLYGLGATGSYRFELVTITVEEFTIRPGERVSRRLEPGTAHVYYLDTDRVVQLAGLPSDCAPLRWEHTEIRDLFGVGRSPFGVSFEQGPLCDSGRQILLVGNPEPDQRHVLVVRGTDTASGGEYTFRID